MPYLIANLPKIGLDEAPFRQSLVDLQNTAFARASSVWDGFTPGGLTPGAKQFGIAPLRKNDMSGDTTDSTPSGSYSYIKSITATGWQDIFNFQVRKDQLLGFGGFSFTDDVLRVSQMRIEIQDRRFPIWDVQLAQNWQSFSLVFKTDEMKELIAEPNNRVLVRIYAESTGNQRVVPIGFTLYRNLNTILTEV